MFKLFLLTFIVISLNAKSIDLSLKESIYQALKNNYSIQISKLNPKIKSNLILKEKANFEPNLEIKTFSENDNLYENESREVSISIDKNSERGTKTTLSYNHSKNEELNYDYNSYISFEIEQNLLKGLSKEYNLASIKIASINRDISKEELKEEVVNIIERVTLAYWNLVEASERLRVQSESLKLSQELYKKKELEVKLGGFAKVYLLEIKADILSNKREILKAKKVVQDTKFNLLTLLNLRDYFDYEINPTEKPIFKKLELKKEEILKQALKSKSEYLKSKLNINIREILNKKSREELLPTLTLEASYRNNSPKDTPNYSPFSESGFDKYRVGLNFSYPILNTKAKSENEKAKFELQKAKLELQNIVLNLHNQIELTLNELNVNEELVELNYEAFLHQQKVLSAESKKLQAGLSNIRDYLYNQNALITSEMSYISSKIAYQKSIANFYKSIGVVPPKYKIEVIQGNSYE